MHFIGWTGQLELLKPTVNLQADEGEEAAESSNPGLSQDLATVWGSSK